MASEVAPMHIAEPLVRSPGEVCPTEVALDVVACKWTVRLIYQLASRPTQRFSELRRALGRVTHKELTKQLRRLEQHGLVARRVFPEVPPRVEYRLTELGATLVAPLQGLSQWAREHATAVAAHRTAYLEAAASSEDAVAPSGPELDDFASAGPKVA